MSGPYRPVQSVPMSVAHSMYAPAASGSPHGATNVPPPTSSSSSSSGHGHGSTTATSSSSSGYGYPPRVDANLDLLLSQGYSMAPSDSSGSSVAAAPPGPLSSNVLPTVGPSYYMVSSGSDRQYYPPVMQSPELYSFQAPSLPPPPPSQSYDEEFAYSRSVGSVYSPRAMSRGGLSHHQLLQQHHQHQHQQHPQAPPPPQQPSQQPPHPPPPPSSSQQQQQQQLPLPQPPMPLPLHSTPHSSPYQHQSHSLTTQGYGKRRSSDKRYKCPICGKQFMRDLPRHMRTHEETARFVCPFPRGHCPHKRGQFNRPYDFKKHLLHGHFVFDNKESKSYKDLKSKLSEFGTCTCGTRYQAEDWLNIHVLGSDPSLLCPLLDAHMTYRT